MSQPVFPDRYSNISKVGSGGMGNVYKAWDKYLDKSVAIKTLKKELNLVSSTNIKRFQKEVQVLAKLKHDSLITVLDFNITEEGTPYQVMDFIEGKTLKEIISNNLNTLASLKIILQIATRDGARAYNRHSP